MSIRNQKQYFDPNISLRERMLRASRGPGDTFLCYKCKKGKAITGRKLAGKNGKISMWICKECACHAAES